MIHALLVLNAGSSSVKFAVFAAHDLGVGARPAVRGQIAGIGAQPSLHAVDAQGRRLGTGDGPPAAALDTHAAALDWLLDWLPRQTRGLEIDAVGHRVVHGGARRSAPARVDAALVTELERLAPLAPHHQPHNLAAIRALLARAPELPQVACFDTAFHAGQPALARRLPLPARYADRGIQRYGFHGLSYEYVNSVLPEHLGADALGRVVVAHLGNGASLCAIRGGRGLDTTMGFSTLDGLMMGTRCGSLDPGVLLYLMREDGCGEAELTELLYNHSGLLGVSGVSADMRSLLASADPRAEEAVALFCRSVVKGIGAMAAVLEGLDALVFSGGIGEGSGAIRERVCASLRWLGLELDAAANQRGAGRISATGSSAQAWVVATNEELVIARHTVAVLRG